MFEARSPDSAEAGAAGQLPRSASAPEAKKPVCIVLHQEHSNPGHVGQWFLRNGHKLDIRKPR
jgi:GMP synthase (glutamine-hydrolysing)